MASASRSTPASSRPTPTEPGARLGRAHECRAGSRQRAQERYTISNQAFTRMPHREDGSPPLDLSLLELVERLSRFNKAPLEAKLSPSGHGRDSSNDPGRCDALCAQGHLLRSSVRAFVRMRDASTIAPRGSARAPVRSEGIRFDRTRFGHYDRFRLVGVGAFRQARPCPACARGGRASRDLPARTWRAERFRHPLAHGVGLSGLCRALRSIARRRCRSLEVGPRTSGRVQGPGTRALSRNCDEPARATAGRGDRRGSAPVGCR